MNSRVESNSVIRSCNKRSHKSPKLEKAVTNAGLPFEAARASARSFSGDPYTSALAYQI